MANKREESIPSIIIYLDPQCNQQTGLEILLGIEEEGIPYRVIDNPFNDPISQAYDASIESLLSVGIAYNSQGLVLHYNKLPSQRPLFTKKEQCYSVARQYGINAARMVKGIAFVFPEGGKTNG